MGKRAAGSAAEKPGKLKMKVKKPAKMEPLPTPSTKGLKAKSSSIGPARSVGPRGASKVPSSVRSGKDKRCFLGLQ